MFVDDFKKSMRRGVNDSDRPGGGTGIISKELLRQSWLVGGSVSCVNHCSAPLPLFFTLLPTVDDTQMDELFIAVEWVVENVCIDKSTRHVKEKVKRLLVKKPLARASRISVSIFQRNTPR